MTRSRTHLGSLAAPRESVAHGRWARVGRGLRTAATCSVLLACTAPSPALRAAERVPEAAKPPAPHAEPVPGRGSGAGDDERLTAIAEALTVMSRIRELPAKAPVAGKLVTRETLAVQVRAAIDRDLPQRVVQAQQDLLVLLGVVKTDFDYLGAVVALMGAELAGYYDPKEKAMYLAADLGDAERDATLFHELVHALQDQHYDLGSLLRYRDDGSDTQSALHALAEGDAMSAMLDQLLAPRGVKATSLSDDLIGLQVRAATALSMSADTPELLKRSLVAPYADGVAFVHALRRQGGYAAVDAAWREPPASTEQLLHPEKYWAREAPEIVPVPKERVGGPGGTPYTDVLGEQSVRQLLEEWLPRKAAVEAGGGWAGDRLAVFREGDRAAVAWHLRYDDVPAAERLTAALLRGVPRADAKGRRDKPPACAERPDRGPLHVERKGRDVAVVAGPARLSPGSSRSDGTCGEARTWAQAILAPDRLGPVRRTASAHRDATR